MAIDSAIQMLVDRIKTDRIHGASELARQAVVALCMAAERSRAPDTADFLLELHTVAGSLMSVRPAMAPVYNIVSRLIDIIPVSAQSINLDILRQQAIAAADRLITDSIEAVAKVAASAAGLISKEDTIMTFSYSSTVLAALKEALRKNGMLAVVVPRSGVGQWGIATAKRLGESGIPVTLVDDTAIGLYITGCDRVMVGADRICADGSLVNGAGTCLLAVMAQRAGIPFYVLCETLKFDHRLTGNEVDVEEKDPCELAPAADFPETVQVKNPYFDVTPPDLIAGVVTEKGILDYREVKVYLRKLGESIQKPETRGLPSIS